MFLRLRTALKFARSSFLGFTPLHAGGFACQSKAANCLLGGTNDIDFNSFCKGKGGISHLLGMLDGPGLMFYQSGMTADFNTFRSTHSVHKSQLEDRRYTGSIHSWWDGRRSVRGKNTGRER
ncbi:hypothetical protein GUITHDRAFT_156500 [Guillardia theta CCMP2712]|uniref:Uncharacterized protein n=1 Tax=Guillardia theta (strain CCMP2712) TaxID=905079 RepID=L1I7A3_GUITC|nr:hypothetical protein GUITHDRAFT_156500 [Guillardia theta CCMP2712]EKX31740.1 hypothetical protein GUITHDRAFT_156500 [Guillardia theta CCMP2712]|eukprot:XP_005818720.1 hypothetical protein GUITHDRAFT_156500 [Guillardia theta CCMP2712]